jgi:hypothetical protein
MDSSLGKEYLCQKGNIKEELAKWGGRRGSRMQTGCPLLFTELLCSHLEGSPTFELTAFL